MVTDHDRAVSEIFAVHQARHPDRGVARLMGEVTSYVRRFAGALPDMRSEVSDLPLETVRQAYVAAVSSEEDITQMFRAGKGVTGE